MHPMARDGCPRGSYAAPTKLSSQWCLRGVEWLLSRVSVGAPESVWSNNNNSRRAKFGQTSAGQVEVEVDTGK